MTINLCCSRCGANQNISYTTASVLKAVKDGWGSYGSALYCPACSATWGDRNHNRPMADEDNTFTAIDRLHTRRHTI